MQVIRVSRKKIGQRTNTSKCKRNVHIQCEHVFCRYEWSQSRIRLLGPSIGTCFNWSQPQAIVLVGSYRTALLQPQSFIFALLLCFALVKFPAYESGSINWDKHFYLFNWNPCEASELFSVAFTFRFISFFSLLYMLFVFCSYSFLLSFAISFHGISAFILSHKYYCFTFCVQRKEFVRFEFLKWNNLQVYLWTRTCIRICTH